jgi:hypothetical protein
MDNAEEKTRNIRLIGIGVSIMSLALIERVIIVFVFNYLPSVWLGCVDVFS